MFIFYIFFKCFGCIIFFFVIYIICLYFFFICYHFVQSQDSGSFLKKESFFTLLLGLSLWDSIPSSSVEILLLASFKSLLYLVFGSTYILEYFSELWLIMIIFNCRCLSRSRTSKITEYISSSILLSIKIILRRLLYILIILFFIFLDIIIEIINNIIIVNFFFL